MTARDPRLSIGLSYFRAHLPKKDISQTRMSAIAQDINIDEIEESIYIPRDDIEYYRAPLNSVPVKRTIAIFGEEFPSGYVIEEADGFLTPYGVFYVEFS